MKIKRYFSMVLCIMLLAVSVCIPVKAVTTASIPHTNVNIRADASTSSTSLGKVSNVSVAVNGSKKGTDGKTWYNITTCDGITGYIREDYVVINSTQNANADFESQLAAFPASYRTYISNLHKVYPSWNFIARNINISFDAAVDAQFNTIFRKEVNMSSDGISWRSMENGNYDWSTGVWRTDNGGAWTSAARQVIAYYMDPRNFIKEKNIFQFLQQSYDPAVQNEAGLALIVKGTFLEKGYSDAKDTAYGGSYIKVIMEAARQSGVSPYVIAATLVLEQGTGGTSSLISGKYPGYESYYNFFNFGASGVNVVENGLAKAKSYGWDSRSKAIIGGAVKYGESYIKVGQDTYFYKDYNIVNQNYNHQYAQNVADANSSGIRLSNAYATAGSANLTFYIPVYTSIPDTVSPYPEKNSKLNNYYFTDLRVNGLNPQFSIYNRSYSLTVSGSTNIVASVPNGASIISAGSFSLKKGDNVVKLIVRAETGYTNTYTLAVHANNACMLTVNGQGGSQVSKMKGDVDGNGLIDVVDLAKIRMYLLGVSPINDTYRNNADIDRSGAIDVVDLAKLRMHLLGVSIIVQ